MSAIGAASGDIGYTPPLDAPNDDGVNFPVTDPSVLIVNKEWITGRPPNAPEFVPNATMPITVRSVNGRTGAWTEITTILPVPNGYAPVPVSEDIVDRYGNSGQRITVFYFPVLQFWLELKNLNRSFSNQYNVKVTDLQIEMMVNLASASTP